MTTKSIFSKTWFLRLLGFAILRTYGVFRDLYDAMQTKKMENLEKVHLKEHRIVLSDYVENKLFIHIVYIQRG